MFETSDLTKAAPTIVAKKETSSVIASQPSTSVLSGRLLSLDVFRGLTIAAMVLVNNAGNYNHVYWPLGHAPWHGWTPTDLIFPFFVFIVGVAIPLAFQRRVEQGGSQRDLYFKIVRRSLLIFFISRVASGLHVIGQADNAVASPQAGRDGAHRPVVGLNRNAQCAGRASARRRIEDRHLGRGDVGGGNQRER